jgi:N-acetylglucosaminyldiphosphoundecaprenol N-acetyl-beta-D-mannosaminyltransferase
MSDPEPAQATDVPADVVDLFGVPIQNCTTGEALARLARVLLAPTRPPHVVFFVNAHTLNLACSAPEYRRVLCSADEVFGDGTGVRWAARLVPELLRSPPGRSLRYYLLGAQPDAIERAAAHAAKVFPGWTLAGHHHGYVQSDASGDVIDAINAAQPELLLVGMGNPKQETWIAANRGRLRVALVMGTGGLFDYWAGDLDRAPGLDAPGRPGVVPPARAPAAQDAPLPARQPALPGACPRRAAWGASRAGGGVATLGCSAPGDAYSAQASKWGAPGRFDVTWITDRGRPFSETGA